MQADLKPLEFDSIRRLLERLTHTPYGADAARALEPAPTLAVARDMQRAVTAARTRIDAARMPLMGQLPDIRAALRQASTPGARLSTQAMHNIQVVMRACAALAEALGDTPEVYPGSLDELKPPQPVVVLLDDSLQGAGSLREDASPELVEAFGERARVRGEVEQVVLGRMGRDDIRDRLDDARKVQWNSERAVIVIRGSEADRVKGVRRGSAMGGRDQIVEPMEAVPLNNRLDTLNGRINAEQQRVLRELTAGIAQHMAALEGMLAALTWIDLAFAAGQLSHHMNAHAPTLVEGARVRLEEAYHPLLLLQFADGSGPQPVPLTLHLDGDAPLLLVTGPNTGGKTVALKTLGLIAAMAWCGLHVPAERDCEIGSYTRLIVDVGDHQSLFHHLSTFAGHVEVLKRILEEADGDTLVLLDELGTGTDPEEGAALAMAVLDELLERKVQGIVNTHLSPLKDYAAHQQGIRNASMQFDHERLAPTYRLVIGEPGVSLGLTIAQKNGLPEALVERARAHLAAIAGSGRKSV
ncbi:MAG TPA: DNA mismatch repair protein MutS [Thioalkalivibrio sp.]|nr:DNA mismatch repair protein MutS [Thioalkalivibrio sp.]